MNDISEAEIQHVKDALARAMHEEARRWRYAELCGLAFSAIMAVRKFARDSDGTATAAANGDLPVPKNCQARADRHRPNDTAEPPQ